MRTDPIKKIIEERGYKYKAIAGRIGVSEQIFSSIMTGRRKMSTDEFFKFCELMDIDPSSLYKECKDAA